MRVRGTGIAVLVAIGLAASACSSGDDASDNTAGASAPAATEAAPGTEAPTTTEAPAAMPADAETLAAVQAALDGAPAGCDPLDATQCLFPYPSNAYAATDETTSTGLRVAIPAEGTPANVDGTHVDPTEWNRNDGFSPSSTLLTYVEDLDTSTLPPWTDLDASLADDSEVVMVDVATGERIPLWAEPNGDDPNLLVIHPAVVLGEGASYAVGLRGLVRTDGSPVEASAAFTVYRDNLTTDLPAIEGRRQQMEATLTALAAAGVDRSELQLAWDFTVASTENITARVLHMRDETLAELGDTAPAFTVAAVEDAPDDGVARRVTGAFTITSWMTGDGSPGNRLNYGADTATAPDALPEPNGTLQATFQCDIPVSVVEGTTPAHLVQYGHGLLGSERQVGSGHIRDFATAWGNVTCATKWAGMSEDDVPNAVTTLQDFSNFPTMADRMQQGMINQIVLGRLMTNPQGLASHPAFQWADGTPLIDTGALYYDGNSQGGIMGIALAALSPDFERAVLGVPGINYSLLLPRSIDFDEYEVVMVPAYPDPVDRALNLSLIQMLWDRGEGAGYVHHVTDQPLPGTPEKEVLMHVAYGDHQVTELSAFIAARTMGVPIHRPVTVDGRSQEVEPGWNLETLTYPSDGSAILMWDSGAAPIPFEAVVPSEGRDPHSDPRADPDVQRQKGEFLFNGTIVDVCDAAACPADPTD
jgi:hypothetical protein